MDDHNQCMALPDSKKLTFKEIARSLLNKEKAQKLKDRAMFIMGLTTEMESKKRVEKTEDQYLKSVLKNADLDNYLLFLARQPSDCSQLARTTIHKLWLNEPEISGPTRLNVGFINSDVENCLQHQLEHLQESRLFQGFAFIQR